MIVRSGVPASLSERMNSMVPIDRHACRVPVAVEKVAPLKIDVPSSLQLIWRVPVWLLFLVWEKMSPHLTPAAL